MSVRLERLEVGFSGRVEVVGGDVELEGTKDDLLERIRAWRAGVSAGGPRSSDSRSRRSVSIRSVSVSWKGVSGPGSEIKATGIGTDDLLSADGVSVDSLDATGHGATVKAKGLKVAWEGGELPSVRKLEAGTVNAVFVLPAKQEGASTEPKSISAGDKASSALDEGDGKKRAQVPGRAAPRVVPPKDVPAPAADPSGPSLRDRLASMAAGIGARSTPDAKVDIGAFQVRVERGKDAMTIGPGRLAVEWKQGSLVVDLAPGAAGTAEGITFKASVPSGPGGVTFEVHGGPIQLSTLGLQEGDLGLRHPERASLRVDLDVELKADGKWAGFGGNVKATDVSVFHEKLAEGAVEGLAVAARVKGVAKLDGTQVQLEDSELDVGALQFSLGGSFERDAQGRFRVDGRFGIPLVPCQDAIDSLPASLVPLVHGMRAAGTLSVSGRLRFDPDKPGDYLFDYRGAADCRFTAVPAEVDVSRLKQVFKRTVYGPDNKKVEIESGPGSPAWVPFGGISQFMEAAVMTTEDGHFRIHHGFDHEAIRNSMRENLLRGSFVRGASTISMQLAKNLYLDRKKTVSRKLQELILTMYLEQALTKEQILELYLNVVEFGPMVYGIGPASWHYFRCPATELTPGQAMVLSSLLPNPKISRFGAGGRVQEGWMKYIWKLVRIAGKRGWLTEDDVDKALGEWVVMGGPPVQVAPEKEGAGIGPAEEPRAPEDRD